MKSKPKKTNRLRQINNILSIFVLILGLYLIIWPFLPKFDFWWKSLSHSDPPLVVAINKSQPDTPIPKDNILVIPSLHLQQTIYDGYPYTALSKGVWHSSSGSTPDRGSNTVMAGHRFTYRGFERGASTFYNLDKLKTGDQVVVYWHGIRYNYQVTKSFVVDPSDVSIENPSTKPEITLYTCTPLWTSLKRLVVQASLAG